MLASTKLQREKVISKFFVILEASCIVKKPHSPSVYWEKFIFMYHNSLHIMKGPILKDDRGKKLRFKE